MTKAGFSFVGAGVLVYFLASQSQIGWLYLFDAIIWGLLVLSALLPWYSLRSLRVERQVLLSGPVPWQLGGALEDEAVEVKLRVTNHGRFARHFIKVVADCPFDWPEKRQRAFLVASLKTREVTAFSYPASCYRRGCYPSAGIVLQSSGPLGLVVRRRSFLLPLNLMVYPRYYPMKGLPAAELDWADWGQALKSSAADEFYGSREYQYGDPLKHIHWRNTARLGNFMLKEFEETSQGSVTVALATGRDFGVGRETTLEYSVKIAASLARLCADSRRTVNIMAGEAPLYGAGWPEAMDYLARLEAGGKATLAELATAPVSGQVVVVVPAIETQLIPTLARLAGQVRGLVVVLLEGFVPDEMPDMFYSRLPEGKVEVISCSRGNLEAAIKKLGDSWFLAGRPAASAG